MCIKEVWNISIHIIKYSHLRIKFKSIVHQHLILWLYLNVIIFGWISFIFLVHVQKTYMYVFFIHKFIIILHAFK